MGELLKKLSAVQSKLKAPKGQYNSFGKYKYRSSEDILEAVKPLLAEQGLVMLLSDDVQAIGDRYYIEATATIKSVESDEEIQVTAFAREAETKKGMDESQITGTASSYARKYALNGLFNIDDSKDADTDEYNRESRNGKTTTQKQPKETAKKTPAQEKKATAKDQIAAMFELAKDLGISADSIKAYMQDNFKKDKTADLTNFEIANIYTWLSTIDKQVQEASERFV